MMLLMFISCKQSGNNNQQEKIQCRVINLDKQDSDKAINLSSIFKGVKPIILETTNESLIGEISKLEIYEDFLFVLDNRIARKLFVFDKKGKFLKMIGSQGSAPGEYKYISDFAIDRESKFIYILDTGSQKINKYDINSGSFISSIKLSNPALCAISTFNGQIYTDIYPEKASGNALLQEIDPETGKQMATFLDIYQQNKSEDKGLLVQSPGVFKGQNSPYPKFSQYLMDTIMVLNEDGVAPFLAIESEYLLTPQQLLTWNIHNKMDFMSKMDVLNKNKIIWTFSNYVECNDLISFNYLQGMSLKTVFYKPDVDSLYICNRVNNDLVFKKDYQSSIVSLFMSADNQGIYSVIGGPAINTLIDVASHNGLNDNLDRQDELKQLPEDSNPVLFYYEYEK
jgi:hypothetical protein